LGVFSNPLDYLEWMLSSMAPGPPEAGAAAAPVPHAQDFELARRLVERDRKAVAEFVANHADALYGYVRLRLAPRSEQADDVVQEVFLAAWQRIGSFRGESPLRAWLLGIARHKIEDVYRQRLREPDPLPEDDGPGETPTDTGFLDDAIDRRRLRARATAVLNELPEAYSTVLLWRYWEHRSTAEMAAATGKTEKAVERLLSRARAAFRRRWQHGCA
jgi:RNA polymerase sigma-70 factor (ECF subfamily)